MKTLKLISIFALVLGLVCGCATMERIDENYTAKAAGYSKIYNSTKLNCQENVKKALGDLGAPIEEIENDRVISNRWEFMRMSEGTASHSQYSSYAVGTQYSIAAKLYINVKETSKNQCQVWLSRVRAWENTSEYEKLNVDQVMNLITVPFFKNLDERLIKQ